MSATDEQPDITAQQQRFIEVLLSGTSITEAARVVGVSRRTATYWMAQDGNPTRKEYERQATERALAFTTRIEKLHDLAISALEDMMSKKAPPWQRFQAAKLIYERHLAEHGDKRAPLPVHDLVADSFAARPSSVEWLTTDERGKERKINE